MKRTLYEVLGVGPEASAEEIAAAYRKRLAQLTATPSQDQSAMALTRDAHDILSDTYLRTNYDASWCAPRHLHPLKSRSRPKKGRRPCAGASWRSASSLCFWYASPGS